MKIKQLANVTKAHEHCSSEDISGFLDIITLDYSSNKDILSDSLL